MSKTENKALYFEKLRKFFDEYKSVFIVNVDNVRSNQMHQIRQALRKDGEVLMGKNTMIRRAMKTFAGDMPILEKLLPYIRGNIGFVFTNSELKHVRERIVNNTVSAPAKAGALAPNDVSIPAGNTGMEPGKTSFFQALGVPTKITKGTIEIVSDFHVIKANHKVGQSEAALLAMLGYMPFSYGMTINTIFDNGTIFSPEVLDIENSQLIQAFLNGARNIASISLEINYPTVASVPHSIANGFKNLLALSVSTDFTFEESKKVINKFPFLIFQQYTQYLNCLLYLLHIMMI